jgi:carbon-monoxide dehydrogenase catalytic subunit
MGKDREIQDLSLWEDAQKMIAKAQREGIGLVWDRLKDQTPHSTFCEQGLTCNKCVGRWPQEKIRSLRRRRRPTSP